MERFSPREQFCVPGTDGMVVVLLYHCLHCVVMVCGPSPARREDFASRVAASVEVLEILLDIVL